jgi:transcriptional regulator with XRE-family HTH domain
MSRDRETIAEYVRSLRKTQALSLRAAAEKAGVSHAYLDSIERCRPNANITIDTLGSIIRALGGNVTLVFGEADGLTEEEWGRVALVSRALLAARDDAALGAVVYAVLDMLEARLTQAERKS